MPHICMDEIIALLYCLPFATILFNRIKGARHVE
jgi:hypothetical protein